MENLWIVATQVGVLFALMALGVVCRRARLVDEAAVKGMVNVLILLVTPCLIVDVFRRPFDASRLVSLGLAFAIALAAHFGAMALAALCVRHREYSTRCVLKIATVFSNAGFMGIPLEQAVLGEEGVFYGITYVVVFNLLMWSWGLAVMKGRGEGLNRMMFANPGTVGIAAGLPVFLLSAELPEVVRAPVHLMAGLNTPLAMLVIGYYLAGARLGPVVKTPAAQLTAVLRLVVCPLLLTAALYPFRGMLDRTMMLAVVIASAAPAGAMVTMFAAKYARDVDMSVGIVSGTTLLSILSMPPVIALAMALL